MTNNKNIDEQITKTYTTKKTKGTTQKREENGGDIEDQACPALYVERIFVFEQVNIQ